MENALRSRGKGLFRVDGHDRGSGTTNIFLIAHDDAVELSIETSLRLLENGTLKRGMRIGRAVYHDEGRKDWHYQPVFPPSLTEFEIMYQGTPAP